MAKIAYIEFNGREHVVDEEPGLSVMEAAEFAFGVEPNSRLSCQIKVSDDLDGLIVRMPESQR